MQEKDFMQIAANEALKAQGMTWTNPLVGAVIVKNNRVLATGYHHQYGHEHAEVNALSHLPQPELAQGATLYVTLEPCCHFGKQPPCTQRIVASGIKKVVVGQVDPHKIVAGKGLHYLEDHGVATEVIGGTDYLNPAYNFFYRNGRPWVTLKYAMSLDGKINCAGNERTLLTGPEAQFDAQKLRCCQHAILIGARTLRIDDPELTVRIKNLAIPPIRIVVTHDVQKINWQSRLFSEPGEIWLLSETDATTSLPKNVHVFVKKQWTPQAILQLLASKDLQALLVEGGSNLQAQFVQSKLADEVVTYLAPQILGGTALPAVKGPGLNEKLQYELVDVRRLGNDVRLKARRK
ncbi:bifunctional diaminohydroxyphosphoribosylaminopyrimidine deaminase/5-amino-6-(5-phosphoribosylamino)uracil reductase RibD [Lactobacillus sp. ESL0791]|uniref:bifunctional diaminohydroxyphosphoribosylaminopyrimidine deaminase/5-amino-6-(5-phosphoribosylamino)uracil reductase RibD n=1 Tax=Lactobacillus sp. ESL0791 TaxID=2983234 RepID=UPI0023F7AE24|nr:bifunctional diaminohydroxyphosphoribosylaminopyrimidine deaminase/5-amino-6-(5-phosphoribosylamino)uracil reductase RibD [Lactobacillus sp. ESL0791]MDF7638205.1 bifunctional diaminohydroxyphosphoribosylaminopyrimidine deaminase/5-amino-6-(5-phosphoribosylamino)uracil reductase RibD [Lactobacillus sp. ESL0791]